MHLKELCAQLGGNLSLAIIPFGIVQLATLHSYTRGYTRVYKVQLVKFFLNLLAVCLYRKLYSEI